MSNRIAPAIPKWPFLLGDLLLLGVAGFLVWQARLPLDPAEAAAVSGCVAFGGLLAVIPFVLQHRANLRLAEADGLAATVLQIQNLETVARQVGNATASWQTVHELSSRTVESARQVGEIVSGTAKSFADFIQKANDAEKNHLRLEVEKLRRAEQEWLQVTVRVLDHVYAVFQAAVRSKRANLIEQLGTFQNACRDTARRVGLVPFVAIAGEPFDPKLHQLADSTAQPEPGSKVIETVATGITFQGQMIRPAMVLIDSGQAVPTRSDHAGLTEEPALAESPGVPHPAASPATPSTE